MYIYVNSKILASCWAITRGSLPHTSYTLNAIIKQYAISSYAPSSGCCRNTGFYHVTVYSWDLELCQKNGAFIEISKK